MSKSIHKLKKEAFTALSVVQNSVKYDKPDQNLSEKEKNISEEILYHKEASLVKESFVNKVKDQFFPISIDKSTSFLGQYRKVKDDRF